MQRSSWSEVGLNLSEHDIAAAFLPFVARHVDPEYDAWRRDIGRRKRKTLRKYLKRRLLGWLPGRGRDTTAVISEYGELWSDNHAKYRLGAPPTLSPWIWQNRFFYAHPLGATRVRHLILGAAIERLRPRRVLEVGCGDGINLILLACRFPEIDFAGVELTREGYEAATLLQQLPVLPEAIQTYAPLPLADPAGFRKIRFVQGNAADLPFPEGAFDLSLTVLALEQMERIREQALREIARVTSGYSLMIEPFADVNATGWPRLNVIRRDYLRGRIADLARYGLEPEAMVDDYPQELFLRTCAVLARRKQTVSI